MANFTAEQYDTLQEILKVITEARQISERWSESWAKGLANPIGPHTTHLSSPITPMTPSQSPQPPDPPDLLLVDPEPLVETMKNSGPFIESLKSASVLQVPDSFCDVLLVHKVDSHVKEVEESPQQPTNSDDKNVAHQVSAQMPLGVTSKEKQRKSLKAWKFKFKTSFKRSKSMDVKFFSVEGIAWFTRDSKEINWGCVNKEFKEAVAGCGKKIINRFKMVDETSKLAAYDGTFQIRVWDCGGSLLDCVWWRRLKHCQRYCHEMQAIEAENKSPETLGDHPFAPMKPCQSYAQPCLKCGAEMTILLAKETQNWMVTAWFKIQVPIPSLEPSRRCHQESLVVVNDLSYDHGCVTGKTSGSICDFELGQDNSLDEEEFKGFKLGKLSKNERRLSAVCLLEKKEVTKTISAWNNCVWEPGGVLIEHDKWKGSEKCYELSRAVRLMQVLSSTRWSYGKVAVLSQELQQPKTYLKEIKLKKLDRLIACSSIGTETWLVKCSCEYKIQKLLLCYHSLKVQEKQLLPEDNVEFPEVSIISMRKGLVCDKEKKRLRNVKAAGCICDLDQVNSLDEEEFMGFTEFSKPQLAMEFLLLNSGLFMNTRLLHDKINSVFVALALLVVSEHNKAIRTRYEKAEKVDKHKINFTVAVIDEHEDIETACVLLKTSLNGSTHTLSQLIKDRDSRKRKLGKNWWFKFKLNIWISENLHLWRKRKSEKLQRASKHIMCDLNQGLWDMSIFGKSRTWLLSKLRIVRDLKDLRQFTRAGIKFHLKHKWKSKFGSSKLTMTWTRQKKAWPRVLPRLHVRAFNLSFLRTRMFSTGEYCYRKYYLSSPVHIYSLGLSNYSV